MKKEVITKLTKSFEEIVHVEAGVEYWMARDIQALLEYDEWRNFCKVIEKAKIACQKSGRISKDHFVDVNKMVLIGSDGAREIPDCKLSRYACYLIAQNGDPRKESIAFAQSYFALQTRKQELLEKHIANVERLQVRHKLTETEKALSSTLYKHGVDDQGFGRIRSKGDQALFGEWRYTWPHVSVSERKKGFIVSFLRCRIYPQKPRWKQEELLDLQSYIRRR